MAGGDLEAEATGRTCGSSAATKVDSPLGSASCDGLSDLAVESDLKNHMLTALLLDRDQRIGYPR